MDVGGKQFGIYVPSTTMKPLTVFAKTIETKAGHPYLTINFRYPVETTADKIVHQLTQAAERCGLELAETKLGVNPYLLDVNNPVIQKLNAIANEVTGSDALPYTLGGGTYAHRLPNALAFGMSGNRVPEGLPAGHGGAHAKDESVGIDRLQQAMKIYARTLLALNEMEW